MNDPPILVMDCTDKVSTATCSECGREFEPTSGHPYCFRCKVQGMAFQFRGVTGRGKKAWNEHTIKSFIDDSVRAEKAAGTHGDMSPVTNWT